MSHDVEQVWAAMLEAPAPPLPTAEEVLLKARTNRRRRAGLAVAGSALATAAVAAAVAVVAGLVGPQAAGGLADPRPDAPPPVAPAEVPPAPLPAAPTWEVADDHGDEIGAILLAALPSGYTGLLQQLSTDGPAGTWLLGGGPAYASGVDVVVTTGAADGMLSTAIYGGIDPLGDDICAAAVTAYLRNLYSDEYPSTCEMVLINGVPVRLSSTHDAERGDVNRAIRLLDGGLVIVEAQQGIPVHQADDSPPPDASADPPASGEHSILGGWPALPAVPLTTAQLAAIAADPGLLP
jgi:hypothetical protein